jgi:hypothetical protein
MVRICSTHGGGEIHTYLVQNRSFVGKMNPVIILVGGEDTVCKQIVVG